MTNQHHGNILAIEDDPDIATMLNLYFSTLGYQVKLSARGREGVQMVWRTAPDVVLLDIMLPDIDGYQVFREIRSAAQGKDIPIVFLTQKSTREDRVSGLELGAVDYITKPFDMDELRLRVERVLRRKNERQRYDHRSGLPGRKLLEDHIRSLKQRAGWVLLDIHIDSLQPFIDVYGFVATDQVLRHTAQFIRQMLAKHGTAEDFAAHPDDSEFVVVTMDERKASVLVTALQEGFADFIQTHYSFVDREQGYIAIQAPNGKVGMAPLMHLRAHIVRPTQQ